MKTVYLFTCIIFISLNTFTQNFSIVETFDEKAILNWEEYANTNSSAIIKDGYLELQCKEIGKNALVRVELPISVEHDFTISGKILVPKLNDQNRFGIFIDLDENFDYLLFLLKESVLQAFIMNNLTTKSSTERAIKLKSGKNQIVNFILERIGNKYVFSINNMKIFELRRKLNSPVLGFFTEDESIIKIDELVIKQDYKIVEN
jgi:hypothetical protein